jgi:very-short-patch-repair endonuclease
MPDCIICGKYTKYHNGKCSACYSDKKEAITEEKITKKELRARAKSTPQARKISDALRAKGINTFLEIWDGHKHIDVAIPQCKLNIEVDGLQHNTKPNQALADLKRTFYSFKEGFFTLRIPNSLVENHFEECVDLIVEICKDYKK